MPTRSFASLAEIAPMGIWDGVLARTIEGRGCSFAVIELEAESVVPEHSHDNEQLGIVITGSVSFRIGEETREVGPGDTWRIPGSVPHEVRAGPEGAVVIDVFAPARDDWSAIERLEPSAPRWP